MKKEEVKMKEMIKNIWKYSWLMYPCTHDRGTGFAGVQILQPVPQPQQNPSTYPGVFLTRDNPYLSIYAQYFVESLPKDVTSHIIYNNLYYIVYSNFD